MRLVVHSVWTSTISNLRKWVPEDPEVFCEIVVVSIGTGSRSQGADEFTLRVATPRGLLTGELGESVVAAGHMLILSTYDFDVLWDWLVVTVRECEAETWAGCVNRLLRWFDWEYDYRS